MNAADAKIVVSTMQSIWPTHSWREGEHARLLTHFAVEDFGDVMAALGLLERTEKVWPPWSVTYTVLAGIKRRRREALEVETEFGEAPVSAERAREYIAQCRTIVNSWSNQSPLKAALEKGWQ